MQRAKTAWLRNWLQWWQWHHNHRHQNAYSHWHTLPNCILPQSLLFIFLASWLPIPYLYYVSQNGTELSTESDRWHPQLAYSPFRKFFEQLCIKEAELFMVTAVLLIAFVLLSNLPFSVLKNPQSFICMLIDIIISL